MTRFEYKVVPAPASGLKAKGVKTSEARFANALQTLMNELGQDGWDYVRADTLPCEERSGLTGRVTKYQNMLVFRRPLAPAEEERAPVAGLLEAPVPTPPSGGAPDTLDPRAPAHSAEAHAGAEPPLHRAGGDAPSDGTSEQSDTSAAARAAAAAFRNVREGEPALTALDDARPNPSSRPGVAAE